ncbi:MAG TPA: hypothetical protein VG322_15045 [Candidatus Acidoferrales bacterium]|nr:hypothetical protein [Candidatus Acidoferrales bacterium]
MASQNSYSAMDHTSPDYDLSDHIANLYAQAAIIESIWEVQYKWK